MRRLLGMRLHSIVFACMTGTPVAALDYDPKVELHRSLLDPPLPSVKLAGLTGRLVKRSSRPGKRARRCRRGRGSWRPGCGNARRATRSGPRSPRDGAASSRRGVRCDLRGDPEGGGFEGERGVRSGAGGGPLTPTLSRRERGNTTARSGGSRKVRIVTSTFFDPEGNDMAYGEAERYLLELARLVRELGYEVEDFQRAAKRDWVRYYRETRVTGVVPEKDPFLLDSAIRRISPNDPALTIYLAFYLGGEASPDSIGISHCVYWDDDYYQSDPALLARHVERALSSIEKLGTLVSVDTNTINWVRATRGSLAGKCVYVPNFVDLEVFIPSRVPRAASVEALFPCRLSLPKGSGSWPTSFPRCSSGARSSGSGSSASRASGRRRPSRGSWLGTRAEFVGFPPAGADGRGLPRCGHRAPSDGRGGGNVALVSRSASLRQSRRRDARRRARRPDHLGAQRPADRADGAGPYRGARPVDRGPRPARAAGRDAATAAWDFRLERWRESWAALLRPPRGRRAGRGRPSAPRAGHRALSRRGTSRDAARRVLWPLASELARRGIDTYWVEGDGSRQPAHPRLHVLSEQDDLELSRPLRFDFQDGEVRISRASLEARRSGSFRRGRGFADVLADDSPAGLAGGPRGAAPRGGRVAPARGAPTAGGIFRRTG